MTGAEQFQRLAWRIAMQLASDRAGAALLVTSSRRGEGRSHVAAALAGALCAQRGVAAALVACEPEPGRAVTGESATPTWCELLYTVPEESSWAPPPTTASIVRIPFGSGDPSASFHSAGVARALNWLRARFELVVLDGPILADCGALGAHSDGTLLVINAERTRREVVKGCLDSHPIADGKMLGAVLNETPRYIPGWLYRRAL